MLKGGGMAKDGVRINDDAALQVHPLRDAVLGELHARPFTPVETPRRILHFGFLTNAAQPQADREALAKLCIARGLKAAPAGAKHLRYEFDGHVLRWECHAEFTTYTWEFADRAAGKLFEPPARALAGSMGLVPQPGPLLVALDLHLVADPERNILLERIFDRASLAAAENSDGTALFATDFNADQDGFVRVLVANRGLDPERAGALVQRVLELETYRTLALLGLPEAQRLAPAIDRIEKRLAEVTDTMRRTTGLSDNHRLLDELIGLAADVEADTAMSQFRFGATRAYNDIVRLRLETIGERKAGTLPTWTSFLARRMAPAMRTSFTVEERMANLSRKLARAANLLRTRVDVAVEEQNRDLLTMLNNRGRMQLRLQQTVEGLSVAAISYYLVGLVNYLLKGVHDAGYPVDSTIGTAIAVPIIVVVIAFIVRRIRRRYSEHAKADM
jgi:uncharacterized membrane-anchored protein